MKPVLFLILFVLIAICSFAQKESNSYYVNLKGDTIYGAVFKVHNTFFYKTSKDVREKDKINLDSIKIIRLINGLEYEKKNLTFHRNGKSETNTFFAKTVITGSASLYSIIKPSDDDEDKAFVVEKNGKSYILSQNQASNGNILNTDTRYLNMLQFLLGDCDSIKKLIPKVLFEEVSLAWIVRSYNNCKSNVNKSDSLINKSDSLISKSEVKVDIHKQKKRELKPIPNYYKRGIYACLPLIVYNKSNQDSNITFIQKQAISFGFQYILYHPIKTHILSFSAGLRYSYFNYSINSEGYYGIVKMPTKKYLLDIPFSINFHIIQKTNFTFYLTTCLELVYAKTISTVKNKLYYNNDHESLYSKFSAEKKTQFTSSTAFGYGVIYKRLFFKMTFEIEPIVTYTAIGFSF